MTRALSTGQFLDFLGIRLRTEAVIGRAFTVNLATPDTGETFVVELSNGTLTNLAGFQAPDPTLTMTVNRADLELAMTGARTVPELIADGLLVLDGDAKVLQVLGASMVHFELGFEMMPGTGVAQLSEPMDEFQAEPLGDSSGG
jgi:alkyl sulfatase BDS1-like metallo-beta-lactamase superfamily hydrolase